LQHLVAELGEQGDERLAVAREHPPLLHEVVDLCRDRLPARLARGRLDLLLALGEFGLARLELALALGQLALALLELLGVHVGLLSLLGYGAGGLRVRRRILGFLELALDAVHHPRISHSRSRRKRSRTMPPSASPNSTSTTSS